MSLFEVILFAALAIVPITTLAFSVWGVMARHQSIARKITGFLFKWLAQCVALAVILWLASALLNQFAGPNDIDPASPFGGVLALLMFYTGIVGSVGFVVVAGLTLAVQQTLRVARAG